MWYMYAMDVTPVTYTLYMYVLHVSLVMLNNDLYVFLEDTLLKSCFKFCLR